MHKAVAMACILCSVLAVAACTSVPVRHRGPQAGVGGDSWALVMGPAAPDAYAGRRDEHLSRRKPTDPRWQNAWADLHRPTLDNDRRLYLSNRAETIIYFRPYRAPTVWWDDD